MTSHISGTREDQTMQPVTIYTKYSCPYCHAAKDLLEQKGVAFEEIPVDGDRAKQAAMAEKAKYTVLGNRIVPRPCRKSSSAARMSAAATISSTSKRRASSTDCSQAES